MTDEQVTRDHRDGSLSVCAAPVTDAPGWLITTRSRRLADAAAATTLPGGTVHARENGEWQARLPEPVLAVMVLVLQPHLETIDSALVMEPPGAGLVAAAPA